MLRKFRFLYFTRSKYIKNNFRFLEIVSNNFDHPLNHNFKDKSLEFPGSKYHNVDRIRRCNLTTQIAILEYCVLEVKLWRDCLQIPRTKKLSKDETDE